VPTEVRLSATPHSTMASAIKTFRNDLGDRAMSGYVVHPGDVLLPLSPGVDCPAGCGTVVSANGVEAR